MAETQNVFVTRTQNRFLPIIQAFTDNLYKHMQMQGELNDKMIAFNKKKQGEQFVRDYSSKITNSSDLPSLLKNMNEAVTYAGSNDLTAYMPVIEMMSRNVEGAIKLKESEASSKALFDTATGIYKDSPLFWQGKETSFGVVANEIKGRTDISNEAKIELMKLAANQLAKEEQNLVIPKDDKGNFIQTQDKRDPTTGKVMGETQQGIIRFDEKTGKYYADYNNDKVAGEDEGISGKVLSQMSEEQRRRREFNTQISLRDKPQRTYATYEGDDPGLKGKTLAVIQKADGKFYDINNDKILPEQESWISRSGINYFGDQNRNETFNVGMVVTSIDKQLSGLVTSGKIESDNPIVTDAILEKNKNNSIGYYHQEWKRLSELDYKGLTDEDKIIFDVLDENIRKLGQDYVDMLDALGGQKDSGSPKKIEINRKLQLGEGK